MECVFLCAGHRTLIVEDFYEDPNWAEHPYIKSGDAPHSYAGFPVVNKDNYVLGNYVFLTLIQRRFLSRKRT